MKKTAELPQKNIAGKRIKVARLRMKPAVTQEDLAGRLAARGISIGRVGITKIESGDRYLLDYELKAIAQALKISPADLLS